MDADCTPPPPRGSCVGASVPIVMLLEAMGPLGGRVVSWKVFRSLGFLGPAKILREPSLSSPFLLFVCMCGVCVHVEDRG